MEEKESKSAVKTILFILLFLGILAIFFAIFMPNNKKTAANSRDEFVKVPTIETSNYSETDERQYNVKVTLTLELTDKGKRALKKVDVEKVLEPVIKSLDYDKLVEKGGKVYLKEEVTKQLSQYIVPEDLLGVYISGIQTGDGNLPASNNAGESSKVDSIYKGLFPNYKN